MPWEEEEAKQEEEGDGEGEDKDEEDEEGDAEEERTNEKRRSGMNAQMVWTVWTKHPPKIKKRGDKSEKNDVWKHEEMLVQQ